MKPINIKNMMASMLLKILTVLRILHGKNSQLGTKVARYLEKGIPTYPIITGKNEFDDILCPNCRGIVGYNDMEEYEKDRCCCHCGQRLKWHE